MLNTIIDAINTRRVLTVNYPPGSRFIEPHAVGHTKKGEIVLRAFQTSGVSASGEHENWKLMRLDRLIDVHLTDEYFSGPRAEFNSADPAMKGGIIAGL